MEDALKILVKADGDDGARETYTISQKKEKSSAKERRLARRAAEREKSEKSSSSSKTIVDTQSNPHVVFVGQLPFSATLEEVKLHFSEGAQISCQNIKVRLLTDPKSGRSKGMAFLEVTNADEMHKALALHRSYFGHSNQKKRRQINVEKSSGGGKSKKRKRIAENRDSQSHFMENTVSRIIDDHVQRGTIQREFLDNDKHLLSMLLKCDAATVDQSLEEFSQKDVEELSNPAAWLTAIVCRKLAESFDAKVKGKQNNSISDSSNRNDSGTNKKQSSNETEYRGMSLNTTNAAMSSTSDFVRRFPSIRGRGRGKGR